MSTLAEMEEELEHLVLFQKHLERQNYHGAMPYHEFQTRNRDVTQKIAALKHDIQIQNWSSPPRWLKPNPSPQPLQSVWQVQKSAWQQSVIQSAYQSSTMLNIIKEAEGKGDPLPVENKFGEIETWRVWRIVSLKGIARLQSMYISTIWEPQAVLDSHHYMITLDHRNNEWRESNKERVAPTDRGQEGIHGWKNLGECIDYARSWTHNLNRSYAGPFAFGRVKLWGEVVEHARGYRGEFARVLTVDGVLNSFGARLEDYFNTREDAKETNDLAMLEILKSIYDFIPQQQDKKCQE